MSQPADIVAYVLDAWIARLADDATGFNPALAKILSGDDLYAIDFPPETPPDQAQSFIRGAVASIDRIIQSSSIRFPLMIVDIVRGSDARAGQYLKFQKFSGTLFGQCQVIISWPEMAAQPDFATIPDATIAALYQAMNSLALSQPDVYPGGIVYNGDLDFQITPTQFGAQGWVRVITANCTFRFSTAVDLS